MSSLALVIFFAIPFFLLQNIAAVFGILEGHSKAIRGQPVKRSLMHESQSENQCNSRQLEKIMAQNILPNDVVGSKLHIMRAAKKQIGGSFNVICARGNFSYITSTRIYCLVERRGVKCFSFLSESKRRQQQKAAAAGIN